MQLSVLVSADYVLQVEIVSYSNPSNTRSDSRCCDSPPGFNGATPCVRGERCDTYFTYCLRPRFTEATTIECPNTEPGFTANSTNVVDGAAIDFSQPTVLGLPNPFNLTGISTAWEVLITVVCSSIYHLLLLQGAQLYIQVFDLDDDGADVIERLRVDVTLNNSAIFPVGTTVQGPLNGVRIVITVRATVLCAPF